MYMYFQPSKQKACRVSIAVRCSFRDFHPQGRSTSGGKPRSLEWQCAYRNSASCLGCWNSTWQASMHVDATHVSRVSFPHVQLNLGTFIGTDHVRFISRISVSDGSSMAARTAHDRLWRRKVPWIASRERPCWFPLSCVRATCEGTSWWPVSTATRCALASGPDPPRRWTRFPYIHVDGSGSVRSCHRVGGSQWGRRGTIHGTPMGLGTRTLTGIERTGRRDGRGIEPGRIDGGRVSRPGLGRSGWGGGGEVSRVVPMGSRSFFTGGDRAFEKEGGRNEPGWIPPSCDPRKIRRPHPTLDERIRRSRTRLSTPLIFVPFVPPWDPPPSSPRFASFLPSSASTRFVSID